MLGWRPCKGRSDQRFLQGDLIQIHVWGQIDRDLTYPTKKGKGKSSSSKVPWDRICYILREYPIHFLSHPKIWVETAETAIGHWWQPSEAAKHQPFPAQVWGCDREVAEQLDNLILGSWSASRIQHKGHQYVKSWRKKLGDLYFNPVIQTRIVNDSLHLHLYATHGFSNVWCSCLGCLQSFHCLGIFKWDASFGEPTQPNSGRWGVSFNLLQSVGYDRRPTKNCWFTLPETYSKSPWK